jgi:hypothetical protein
MFDFIPDAERLSQIFSQAIAPTFFLGAVAAFISLMAARLSAIMMTAPNQIITSHALHSARSCSHEITPATSSANRKSTSDIASQLAISNPTLTADMGLPPAPAQIPR